MPKDGSMNKELIISAAGDNVEIALLEEKKLVSIRVTLLFC
jgi:hypothetical protein